MLLVTSPAYAMLVFLVHHSTHRPLSDDIWAQTFLLWAFSLGIIVPTLLYTREKETATAHFLFSKPMDKFRLWWWRLFVGLTVVITSALLVYGTVHIMALPYEKTATFGTERTELVWRYTCFGIFIYGLSSLTSTLFRRRVIALVTSALILILLFALWAVAYHTLEPIEELREIISDSSHLSGVRYLVLAPLFLFASLIVFARDSLWRQTRKTIIAGYALSAVVLLVPSIIGTVYISSEAKAALNLQEEGNNKGWYISRVFDDGALLLAHMFDGQRVTLVTIDLHAKRAHIIDKGNIYGQKIASEGDAIVYAKTEVQMFPNTKIILSDLSGKHKTELYRNPAASFINPSNSKFSLDGNFIGLAKTSREKPGDEAFVAIYDLSGAILGKHTFPALETAKISLIGWDAESRLYFSKEIKKNAKMDRTYWRISIDDFAPEAVRFIPKDVCKWINTSPDGKWFVRTSPRSQWNKKRVLRLTDIDTKEDLLVSENMTSYGIAQDGRFLVFTEKAEDEAPTETREKEFVRVMVFDLEKREKKALPLEKQPSVSYLLPSWSYSSPADTFGIRADREYFIFSPGKQGLEKVAFLNHKWWPVYWEIDGRVLWQVDNKLISTEHDGSNPREIFRLEGRKFFFNGEGQS